MASLHAGNAETGKWLAVFERYASAAGAHVHMVGGPAEAAAVIAPAIEAPVRCTSAVRDPYPDLYRALRGELGQVDVVEDAPGASRSEIAASLAGGTGIVAAVAGVAETGSVVLADNALTDRLLGMLSEVCVVVLDASNIVRSLDEAGGLIAELDRAGHRYVSMVTGPSRTADIERVLTIGVQGPKALHIVVLSDGGTG
jgi:L-lactate dehydrogenase complex protein LldG